MLDMSSLGLDFSKPWPAAGLQPQTAGGLLPEECIRVVVASSMDAGGMASRVLFIFVPITSGLCIKKLSLFHFSVQAGHLLVENSLQLPLPSSGMYLASASLQSDSLTVTWSTGALQVFSLQSSSRSSRSALAQSSAHSEAVLLSFRQLAVTCPARPHHTSSSSTQSAAAVQISAFKQQYDTLPNGVVKGHADTPPTKSSKKHKKDKASSKKRKEAEAEEEATSVQAPLPEGVGLVISTSLAEGSVALASWETCSSPQQQAAPAVKQGGLRLSLFDACYGGVQHSQLLQGLQTPSATAHFQVTSQNLVHFSTGATQNPAQWNYVGTLRQPCNSQEHAVRSQCDTACGGSCANSPS